MTGNEIVSFLLPQADILQWSFGGIIAGAILATMASVSIYAKAESWEKKWNGGTVDDHSDDLDADHGSINDISSAVATRAEKVADVMPGMLLILGLLGTFLGLGIALNKASMILVDANNGAGMDAAMSNLMGMMEGLGTKFKTSTWGIMAFLALKVWSAYNGYDERRLRWCAVRMKNELERARFERKAAANHEREELILSLKEIGTSISEGFAVNQKLQRDHMQLAERSADSVVSNVSLLQSALLDSLAKIQVFLDDGINVSKKQFSDSSAWLIDAQAGAIEKFDFFESKLNLQIGSLHKLCDESFDRRDGFLSEQLKFSINALSEISSLIEKNMGEISSASDALGVRLNDISGVAGRCASLLDTIGNLAVKNNNQNDSLGRDMQATSRAVQAFIDANSSNLNAMEMSSSKMADAALKMGDAAIGLHSAIGEFKYGVADVLGTLKEDLGQTIDQMSGSFTKNMGDISSAMSVATDGISVAVGTLSKDVKETMASVEISIANSLKIQQESQDEFLSTSENLNSQVVGMKNLIDQMQEKIVNGLSAVSRSGLEIAHLSKKFDEVTQNSKDLIQKFGDFSDQNHESAEAFRISSNTIAQCAEVMQKLVWQFDGFQADGPLSPLLRKQLDVVEMIQSQLDKFSGDSGDLSANVYQELKNMNVYLYNITSEGRNLAEAVQELSSSSDLGMRKIHEAVVDGATALKSINSSSELV